MTQRLVITEEGKDSSNSCSDSKNAVITINSAYSDSLAEGIARMVRENQCPACGKFNGLHREIFYSTGNDGFGSVTGAYRMCPNS